MQRENTYNVRVTVSHTDSAGATKQFSADFDKFDAGDVTVKETKYRPANGGADQIPLGGAREVSNIKVSRLYDDTIDPWTHWLIAVAGRASMVVTKQPLDANYAPFGAALVYTGKLNGVNPPKTDSESDAAAIIELELSAVTPIG